MKLFVICLLCCSLFAKEDDLQVMGVGFCTIDLLVQVEDSFVEEHVTPKRGDSVLATFEWIDEVLSKAGKEPKVVPGGSAANTIRALSQLGQSCAFLGHVGQDHWGTLFTSNLQELGVDPRLKEAPFTSCVLCLIAPDGQRTFLGCDPHVDRMPTASDFEDIHWIHLEARNLYNRAVFEKTVAWARELNIPISLDLSCCATVNLFKPDLLSLIDTGVDIIFCNEEEGAALLDLESPEDCCQELQRRCPVAIITLGKDGCLIGYEGKVAAIPACPANVLDTTGAGDGFAAGFLYGYLRNRPLEECASIGHLVAGAVVEVIGTELPQERWEVLRQEILR